MILFSATGFESSVDPLLVAAIRNQKPEQGEDQYVLSCLLMVFIAVIIPRRAALINSTFDANKQGHVNNTHCMGMYRQGSQVPRKKLAKKLTVAIGIQNTVLL